MIGVNRSERSAGLRRGLDQCSTRATTSTESKTNIRTMQTSIRCAGTKTRAVQMFQRIMPCSVFSDLPSIR